MNFSYWNVVISPVISVVSIFISNWLGRKSEDKKYKKATLEKAYINFYIPLMKQLIRANENSMTYYYYVAVWYGAPDPVRKQTDFLAVLLKENLEYLPPKIIKFVSKYEVSTAGAQMFFGPDGYRENYRYNLIEASDLFDKIIESSLKEAMKISNKLGYPKIAKPILKSFENLNKNHHNNPRYLPDIYQANSPRQFVGDEPPYY